MPKFSGKFILAAVAVLGTVVFAPAVYAETLHESLISLVKNQKQIKAKQAILEKEKEETEAARGDWYPELGVTGSYGKDKRNKASGTDDVEEVPRQLSLTLTQQVWDFGSSNAAIRSAQRDVEEAQWDLIATRQGLVLEGIESYLDVIKFYRVLNFAKGSVDNIRRQTELEDARVQRGSGFTTDVLQAKTQLAGAEVRRNNFAKEFRNAVNVYRRWFNREPGKVEDLKEPRVPFEMLPKTLDELVRIMLEDNPGLKKKRAECAAKRENVNKTRADEFFPTLDAIAETKRNQDFAGTVGNETEQTFKLELNYSLNLGLTQRNTLRASEMDHLSCTEEYIDARVDFEKEARNSWSELENNRSNVEFLKNQANIAGEFLELARRERQLGNRSLIDVLAGETALINANSDATAREIEMMKNVFQIINIMGKLETDVLASK